MTPAKKVPPLEVSVTPDESYEAGYKHGCNDGFVKAKREAAALACQYCRGIAEGVKYPEAQLNEQGIPVHRVFSTRGLAQDHVCEAWSILELQP